MRQRLRSISTIIFLVLVAYMPFHVLLATWVGSSLGVMTVAKIFKDVFAVAGLLIAAAAAGKTQLRALLKNKLTILIMAYGLLTIVLATFRSTEQDAEVLGVVYNLRFFAIFIYGAIVAGWPENKHLLKKTLRFALVSGAVVAIFGIVQYLVLPNNALSHLGYSRANGTPPAFFIDEKPDLERSMSTLKDPNSLGSYMLIIIALSLAFSLCATRKLKKLYISVLLLSLACLWFSFSRGALIGLVATVACLLALEPTSFEYLKKYRNRILLSLAALLCIATLSGLALRNSYLVKNVIFHADEQTVLENPNQLRARFFKESISRIAHNPLGSGPGTAGLTSIRNQTQGTILNENYYLQIAEEVGWLGIIIFVAILFTVIKKLLGLRHLPAGRALLASLAGLLITSLLIHTWSNETIAYTWWGLAGLFLRTKKSLRRRNLYAFGGKS